MKLMSEHPIQGMMDTSMQKIKEMVDVNTIIGEPIHCPDGTMIIPVSKVTYGFASGGSDFPTKTEKDLFGGGSGAGITISPVAFLTISNGEVKLLPIAPANNTADRIVEMVPDVVDKVSALFKKEKKQKNTAVAPEQVPAPKPVANQEIDIEID